jgi:hypothetical protein
LQDGDNVISGNENLLQHATIDYKTLFGPRDGDAFAVNPDIRPSDQVVSGLENELLISIFEEEEVRGALFQMEKNKTAGSDGFPIEFFQVGWGFMKNDIMELFNDFHKGTLRLNYGIITLLPKLKEAYKIQQFRLICLLNCIYKLFTKVLTLRLEPVASRIIHLYQSAFIAGRNIKENIIALHLVLHETKKGEWK